MNTQIDKKPMASSRKKKTTKRTFFTSEERELQLGTFTSQGLTTMHVCRHSGCPDAGLLVGRSLFPVLLGMVHRRLATGSQHSGRSLSQMLEDLYSQDIIDDMTHVNLRRAAAALGDFGTGRDLQDVEAACQLLQALTKTEAYKNADAVRRATRANQATDRRRPAVLRWASAAAGLFSAGSAS